MAGSGDFCIGIPIITCYINLPNTEGSGDFMFLLRFLLLFLFLLFFS